MAKLDEGRAILLSLGLPVGQQNEAAAYTLLALCGLREADAWSAANRNSVRIHDILVFIREAYGKSYAENTRETIRRNVLHQFEQAHLVDRNPDDPARPTNSGKTCYALTEAAQTALRAFGTKAFKKAVAKFRSQQPTLTEMYRSRRAQNAVEIQLPDGAMKYLSPGRHNELQAAVVTDFYRCFVPAAKLLYLGDTAKKDWHVDHAVLEAVGLPYSIHDKFPDVVFWLEERDWLVLVEAVTSHGPFNAKRRHELEALLQGSTLHRVYVTAFPTWAEFRKHMADIAWETEVWLAEVPDHMIHFNGPKFLAPFEG